ncbi:hypothetical protein [Actinoplanes sp. NPDC026623]|uniref:hypothetical protein n=1 Tax=Actinoplanes sp. NPDC026623 TaxID=3155610 RepID=UPI0033D3A1FE
MSLRRYLSEFHPPVDESVLVDATSWLDDDLFWPAFLFTVGGSETAAVAFAADPADVEAYAAELHHADRWPFVVVRLASGDRLYVLFRNFEGDAGWDYLRQPAGTDTVTTVAALEGHFQGPAFSWEDLIAVASRPDPTRSAAERLLLLLPAMGDADLPDEAGRLVAAALDAVGVRQRYRREVARELLTAGRRFWGAPGPATSHG